VGEGLFILQNPQNCFDDAFGVGKDIVVPEPNHVPALFFEDLCPPLVCFAVGMLTAVSFNDELMLCAGEVYDEITDRMLPAKTTARQTSVAQ